jgi:dTDP-4-amino-4,6-dideoxygalactose transaminase
MNFNMHRDRHRWDELKATFGRVLESGIFIMGPELRDFEHEFAAFCGVAHAVGVGSGTDALKLSLQALGVKPGDEVISPAMNVAYTALAISAVGAVPVFADVDPNTLTLTAKTVRPVLSSKTRAIIPVHLYGRMADMVGLKALCEEKNLLLIEDACQAHGAKINGQRAGSFGHTAAFSFYPTKNLGAFGDGGMIVTNDPAVAKLARTLRDGGRVDRYVHAVIGSNTCLDEVQAAFLRVRLPHLVIENAWRRWRAGRYCQGLKGVGLLWDTPDRASVHHLFPVFHPRRDELMAHLRDRDVPSLVHYPVPLHLQPCYEYLGHSKGDFPVSEKAANEELSLPMFPDMTYDEQDRVITAVNEFTGKA